MLFFLYFALLPLTSSQEFDFPPALSDCTHLILPERCQCYHSGNESQLHCQHSALEFLPKLPNNMRWYRLDFSFNAITSIDSYVFSDIYVEKVDLHSNALQTIDVTAFDHIQNLRQLFIHRNQLKDFLPNVLTSPGATLEILDMSNNPFEHLNLGGILRQVPFLREFRAVACQLNDSSLRTLSQLSDQHNYIQMMDLSYNNLTSLCNRLFDRLTSLVELRLTNNKIRSIDNDFIRSLEYLKILDLASNSIKNVPSLFSSSLERWNLSSNHIRSLDDYFAANLHSIRIIDFDFNQYLDSISPRVFCSINILSLQKLSFRHDNILSLEPFADLLCLLLENKNNNGDLLDVNHNVNLECNCILTQFHRYLTDYSDLTCTQQGQDRYFISKLANSFSTCTLEFCAQQDKEPLCQWNRTEPVPSAGACSKPVFERLNTTKKVSNFKPQNNSTGTHRRKQASTAASIRTTEYIWMTTLLAVLHSIGFYHV